MAEAPSIVQLAQDHPELNIIGIGAQDNEAQALDFVARTGTGTGTIEMVWDPSFDSWREFGVRSQPYWIVFDAAGELRFSSPGAVDVETVRGLL